MDALDTVAKMNSELQRTQKAADNHRQILSRQQKSFSLFGDGFSIKRSPEEVAQEIWRGMVDPMKVSVSMTLKRIKEMEEGLTRLAKAETSAQKSIQYSREADRAREWHRKVDSASCTSEGIGRGRFLTMMSEALPETGEMRDFFIDAMDSIKKGENKKNWEDKIFQHGMNPGTPAANKGGADSKGKQTPKQFPYKNKAEYVAAGGNTDKPAFAKPKHLPSYMNKWCRVCCYATHDSRYCWSINGKPKDRRDRSRSPPRNEHRRDDKFDKPREKKEYPAKPHKQNYRH